MSPDVGDILRLIFYLFLIVISLVTKKRPFFFGAIAGIFHFLLALNITFLHTLASHGLNTPALIMLVTIGLEVRSAGFKKTFKSYFPFYLGICLSVILAEAYGACYGLWENEYGSLFEMKLHMARVLFFSYFCIFFLVLKLGDCFRFLFGGEYSKERKSNRAGL